jgi:2-furoate---CoA ligase
MLDLGTGFLASALRDPDATAIVDGQVRLSYRTWLDSVLRTVAGFDRLGLTPGDHVVTLLQNRLEAATLYWAAQLAGLVLTPFNWRANAGEVDFCIADCSAQALFYQDVSEAAVLASRRARNLCRIGVGLPPHDGSITFDALLARDAAAPVSRARYDDWSIMFYTSGTTARPKGVPRRHRAERAAGIAHVGQNLYRRGEVTLGAMPLYHTMGVRSLIAMSLIGGTFLCMPRFDAGEALRLIARERVSTLYLVPTLYHDLLHDPDFGSTDVSSVRKLGFAGASMTDGLLKALDTAFRPELFVNHYGSSEIYTITVEQNAPGKPGSAGKAGLNQIMRVVRLGAATADDLAAAGEEGEIVAFLQGDEAFEGYWRRSDADAAALRGGWYFTKDMGRIDAEGDLFITGRIDDMIITGGENVSPVEIENCLSMHPGVSEIAVFGQADERWGQIVVAAVKRCHLVEREDLDQFCRASGLASHKQPRRYLFVESIPKSPVGKLLRRKLASGEYQLESAPPGAEASPSPFQLL